MQNTLEAKSRLTIHRVKTGAPVAADPVTLSQILISGAIQCDGWASLDGFIKLAGGTTPTVSLVPLMVADYGDTDGSEVVEYIVMGTAMGPYSDGDSFRVDVARGRLYLRISAVTGNPTEVKILLGGAARDNQ